MKFIKNVKLIIIFFRNNQSLRKEYIRTVKYLKNSHNTPVVSNRLAHSVNTDEKGREIAELEKEIERFNK